MTRINYKWFNCDCSDIRHHFVIVHDEDTKCFTLSIKLNNYLPWYKRVLVALGYVFSPKRQGSHTTAEYETVELNYKQAKELEDILREKPPLLV